MITVVGSLNMDLFVRTPRLPRAGETVLGGDLRHKPGGKGANQACAAARLGAKVTMIGAVGADAFGEELIGNLKQHGVGCETVIRKPDRPTGTALIVVDEHGENQIVVAPGANGALSAEDIHRSSRAIQDSQLLLTQLETPLEAVAAALAVARAAAVPAILNPAPARALPEEILRRCDWIIANEIETEQLCGASGRAAQEPGPAARALRARAEGAQVVVTLGAAGAWIEADDFSGLVPAFPVEAVDTVGAGDAFIGAFVTRLTERASVWEAAMFGCAAAALAVTRPGAQASLPNRTEVTAFLAQSRSVRPGAPVRSAVREQG